MRYKTASARLEKNRVLWVHFTCDIHDSGEVLGSISIHLKSQGRYESGEAMAKFLHPEVSSYNKYFEKDMVPY